LHNYVKNNRCKVSRRRARDRDQNLLRPRRDLTPRLQKTDLETSLETPLLYDRKVSCPAVTDIRKMLLRYRMPISYPKRFTWYFEDWGCEINFGHFWLLRESCSLHCSIIHL